jgi:hypothetical protein
MCLCVYQSCDGSCSQGYYCPPGSVSATAFQCGNASVVCPAGSSLPVAVLVGYYSVGGASSAVNTAQLPCDPGTYCVGGVSFDCPAGRWGNNATGASSICPNVCGDGYNCPARSTALATCGAATVYCVGGLQYAVPLGMYSTPVTATVDVRTGAASCPPGSYCTGGDRSVCGAGQYGATWNLTTSTCSGQCAAGYYCPANSTSSTALQCGSAAFYCPVGSGSATAVSTGYYSTGGGSAAVQTAQLPCEAGYYCVGGVRSACLAGTYSSATQLSSACSAVCPGGYFCPSGSSTPSPCGSADKYCPAGSGAAVSVSSGYYTTPVTGSVTNRTGQAQCEAGSYCVSGVKYLCPGGVYGAAVGLTATVSARLLSIGCSHVRSLAIKSAACCGVLAELHGGMPRRILLSSGQHIALGVWWSNAVLSSEQRYAIER